MKPLKKPKIHCICRKKKSCHQNNVENCLCPLHFVTLKRWLEDLKEKMEIGIKAAEIFEKYKNL